MGDTASINASKYLTPVIKATLVHSNLVYRSDFCFANICNGRPTFPRLISESSHEVLLDPSLLKVEDVFGTESPIVSAIDSIRRLSRNLDPKHVASVDRVEASSMIYSLEYDLLLLNDAPTDASAAKRQYSFEVLPLKTAVHLYLYLVIREIPQSSKIINGMVWGLQNSTESQLFQWWNSTVNCQIWLLWTLFMGYTASIGGYQRFWFVQQLAATADLLGIFSHESLKLHLEKVLWQDTFFTRHCESLWEDIMLLGETELGL